jgi:uncharacterized protein YndB with AHSA1/START domain
VPRTTRSATVPAPPEEVWRTVADPHHLPRWWPRVQRVEEVSDSGWTMVLVSDRGKPIRADYALADSRPMELLEWRQELTETPFERMLSQSRIVIELGQDEGPESTAVVLRSTERLRGLARLGSPMVRRATRKRLNQALERLGELVE